LRPARTCPAKFSRPAIHKNHFGAMRYNATQIKSTDTPRMGHAGLTKLMMAKTPATPTKIVKGGFIKKRRPRQGSHTCKIPAGAGVNLWSDRFGSGRIRHDSRRQGVCAAVEEG